MAAPAIKLLMACARNSSPSLSSAIMALSPVGYWKLDDTSGTTAVDSSGNGRNGTYTQGGVGGYILSNIAGPDGVDYVEFKNTGQPGYVIVSDINAWSLNNASGLTFFACIKPDDVSITTRNFILGKGTASNYEYAWEANQTVAGRLGFFIYTSVAGSLRSVHTNSGVLTTNWQAVAAYSASPTDTSAIEIRRNSNTELGSVTKQGTPASSYTNGTAALWLANRTDNPSGQSWDGSMAHVAIFAGQVDLSTVFAAADADGWY